MPLTRAAMKAEARAEARRAAIVGRGIHHHDPFRGGTIRSLPRISSEPFDGPVSLLAYVDRYPPFVNAGAEWMLHAMLRDSVRRGHRVMVATACVAEPCRVEGVEVYPAKMGPALAEQAHAMVGHLLWTNEAIRLAANHDLPLLYLVHNDSQIRYWKLGEAKVSAYVWNSEWVAAKCSGDGEAVGVPGTIVRPPLVAADYALTDPPPAEREFVTLVNPIEAKGSEVFYRLAEEMPERRFLAVEGAYGSQQRPKARHRNVEWQPQTGAIRDDVLARTRVLLVGSSYESWGRIAVEACAAGIPVIATPTPGLLEALGDDWPLLAPFGELKSWRALLEELDDEERYAEASARALSRAAELDALGALDLERWDKLVRMAAATTVERMTGHDPFRARSAAALATDAEDADRALLGHAGPDPDPGSCPDLAADVAAWIAAAETPEEGSERADRAWAVELARSAGVRKTVADAVNKALESAESASEDPAASSAPESAGAQESVQEPAIPAS